MENAIAFTTLHGYNVVMKTIIFTQIRHEFLKVHVGDNILNIEGGRLNSGWGEGKG